MKLTFALILLLAITKLSYQNEGIVNKNLTFVNQTIPSDVYEGCQLYSYNSLLEKSGLNNSIMDGINTTVIKSNFIDSNLALRHSYVINSSLVDSIIYLYQSYLKSDIDGGILRLKASSVGQSFISSCRVIADLGLYMNGTFIDTSNVTVSDGYINGSHFFKANLELNESAFSDNVIESLESDLTILDFDHGADNDFALINQDRNPRQSYVLNSEFSGFMTLSANSVSAHNNSFYAVYLYALNSSITENLITFTFLVLYESELERNYVNLATFSKIFTSKINENIFHRSRIEFQEVQSRHNTYALSSGIQANHSTLDSDIFINSQLIASDSKLTSTKFLNSTIDATNSNIVKSPIFEGFANITNSTLSSTIISKAVVVVNYSTVRDIIFQETIICNKNSTFSGIKLQGSDIYDYDSTICRKHYQLQQQVQIEREAARRQQEEESKENVTQEEWTKIMNLE